MRVRKFIISLGLLLLVFACLKFFSYLKNQSKLKQPFIKDDIFVETDLSDSLNFSGELIPLHDVNVRNAIEKQLNAHHYSKTSSHLFHKNSARWFKIIVPVLKQNGIPEDFKYIALIESHFSNSISKRGAAGFWQFIESTATDLGLKINEEVDERLHVEKSTRAACLFFKNAYKKLGNWTLVAAAYNMGLEGLQIKMRNQKIKSYYSLDLSNETSQYVFKILAMKEILTYPLKYGYKINKSALYPLIQTRKIKVDTTLTDLKFIAANLNTNEKILRMFNPWILKNKLTVNDSISYIIEVPKEGISESFLTKLMEQDSTTASRLSHTID
jgi:membrane-bound lytic murein transglycosylase D